MFNSWSALSHTLLVGTLGYIAVIVLLRLSGKRTLSKWNAFDFVVTIAFGSILASLILSTNTSLAQGVLGFGLLVFYQFALTWASTRSSLVCAVVKDEPTLLFYQGDFRQQALTQERVARGEILAAVRSQGIGSLKEVDAVVLETDGSFSVIRALADASALRDVAGLAQ